MLGPLVKLPGVGVAVDRRARIDQHTFGCGLAVLGNAKSYRSFLVP